MDDGSAGFAKSRAAVPSRSQVRGARGFLDWSRHDLAAFAQISVSTIKRMETPGSPPVSEGAWTAVRSAMEAVGVRFLTDDKGGEGIWFARRDEPGADRA